MPDSEIDSFKELVNNRFASYDKAIDLLQKNADKQPSVAEVALRVTSLQDLMLEKFDKVQTQIAERDVRVIEAKGDAKLALQDALTAQKEAVGKTEVGFTKELDSVKLNQKTETDGLRREINDVKSNQSINMGAKEQGVSNRTSSNATIGQILALASILVSISSLVYIVLHKM